MLIPSMRSARERYLEAQTPRVGVAQVLGAGILIGAAVGFIVGVVMAPASGRVTRGRIRRRAGEMQDTIRESADELGDAGRDLVDAAGQTVKTSVQDKLRERGIIPPRDSGENEGEQQG
jgi:hypothetical protein